MDIVEYAEGDIITSAWANLLKDHLQDGTKGIVSLSLEATGGGDIQTTGNFTDGTNNVTASQMKSAYDGLITPTIETKSGSDCSGSNGESNRILTLNVVPNTLFLVGVGGQLLFLTTDYTVSGNQITFLGKIFDAPKILVLYFI